MFHRTSFCFLSVLLVCLWSVPAVGDSNSQGWSDNPELKAAFETGWLDRITTPVPSRLVCKGKTLYRVQPDLSADSYVHEKETLDHPALDLDVVSGLVTFKPDGAGSPEENWFIGEIKEAGGSQLIIGWGGEQFSSINFSFLGSELVLVENILYDNKTYSDMSKEYVFSETVIYLCEASNSELKADPNSTNPSVTSDSQGADPEFTFSIADGGEAKIEEVFEVLAAAGGAGFVYFETDSATCFPQYTGQNSGLLLYLSCEEFPHIHETLSRLGFADLTPTGPGTIADRGTKAGMVHSLTPWQMVTEKDLGDSVIIYAQCVLDPKKLAAITVAILQSGHGTPDQVQVTLELD